MAMDSAIHLSSAEVPRVYLDRRVRLVRWLARDVLRTSSSNLVRPQLQSRIVSLHVARNLWDESKQDLGHVYISLFRRTESCS